MTQAFNSFSLPSTRWRLLRDLGTWPCRWWHRRPRTTSWPWSVPVWRCSSWWGCSAAGSPSESLRSSRTGRLRPPLWGQDIFNDRNWKRPPRHFTPDAPESPPHRLYFPPASFFTLSHSWGHLHGNDITHNPSCQRFSHILIWYKWRVFFVCFLTLSLFAVGLRGKDREGNW